MIQNLHNNWNYQTVIFFKSHWLTIHIICVWHMFTHGSWCVCQRMYSTCVFANLHIRCMSHIENIRSATFLFPSKWPFLLIPMPKVYFKYINNYSLTSTVLLFCISRPWRPQSWSCSACRTWGCWAWAGCCQPTNRHTHRRKRHPHHRPSRPSHPNYRTNHCQRYASHPNYRTNHRQRYPSHPNFRTNHPNCRTNHPNCRTLRPTRKSRGSA